MKNKDYDGYYTRRYRSMKKVILYLLFKLGDNLWKINNRYTADLYQIVMGLYFKLSERWKM